MKGRAMCLKKVKCLNEDGFSWYIRVENQLFDLVVEVIILGNNKKILIWLFSVLKS